MIETVVIVGVGISVVVSTATVLVLLWTGYRNRERYFRDFESARSERRRCASRLAAQTKGGGLGMSMALDDGGGNGWGCSAPACSP